MMPFRGGLDPPPPFVIANNILADSPLPLPITKHIKKHFRYIHIFILYHYVVFAEPASPLSALHH